MTQTAPACAHKLCPLTLVKGGPHVIKSTAILCGTQGVVGLGETTGAAGDTAVELRRLDFRSRAAFRHHVKFGLGHLLRSDSISRLCSLDSGCLRIRSRQRCADSPRCDDGQGSAHPGGRLPIAHGEDVVEHHLPDWHRLTHVHDPDDEPDVFQRVRGVRLFRRGEFPDRWPQSPLHRRTGTHQNGKRTCPEVSAHPNRTGRVNDHSVDIRSTEIPL